MPPSPSGSRRRLVPGLPAAALVVAALAALPGCDNPTCVFAGTCTDADDNTSGGPGGLGSEGAAFPSDGAFMSPAAPEFVAAAPNIMDGHPETPIFLEFSESLDPSTIGDAFEVIDLSFGQPFPVVAGLAGNGRVVVLLPPMGFQPSQQLQVRYREGERLADLNGQRVNGDPSDVLLALGIAATPSTEPRLLYSYPPDMSINQSNVSEYVLGFDRRLDSSTIDGNSFDVTVAGVDPAFDPAVQAFSLGPAGIAPAQTQVWLWQPFDTDGRAVPYDEDALVRVQISQGGNTVLSEGGDTLPPSEAEFNTLNFSPPLAVVKNPGATPADAFGSADVFGGGPVVDLSFANPVPADLFAEIFLIGRSPTNINLNRALQRSVAIPLGATALTLTSIDLDLVDASGAVEFLDGPLEVAVQLRRNTRRSGVRRFDADVGTTAFDLPLIDTTPPMLLGLGSTGSGVATFQTDVRDMTLVGRSSEEVAFAFVDAGMDGTNGGSLAAPPAVAFATAIPDSTESLFVAAPVAVGALDPVDGVRYTLTIFDRAMNATTMPADGIATQIGIAGPGGAPTGANVDVRVFDRSTLLPVQGALVFSHQEQAGALTFLGMGTTGATGVATVPGAAAGATVVSADAAGYDLFTFHGVPRDRVDLPIEPTMLGISSVEGEVQSVFPSGNFVTATNVVADTRAPRLARISDVMTCGANGTGTMFVCPFGPVATTPNSVGGITFLATEQSLPQGSFNPAAYLRGFGLTAPLPAAAAGQDVLDVVIDAGDQLLLSPMSQQAVALMPHVLSSAGATNLGMLDGDPTVLVEAAAAGLRGPLTVGRAIPYPLAMNTWTVLGAVAGVAAPGGDLETRNAIDPDLYLRAAIRDAAGNEVAARPRLSGSMNQLDPIDVPRFLSPGPGGMSGGTAYNIVVADTLPDALALDGVVRVDLTGSSGRRWTIVGLDTTDAAGDYLLSVPDLVTPGGSGLPVGSVSAEVTLFGGVFDRGHFLWTDLEREHLQFGYAAPVTFTQN